MSLRCINDETQYDYRSQWQKEGLEIPIARANIGKEPAERVADKLNGGEHANSVN